MANKNPKNQFTSERAREAGKKSKRKPLDVQWRDKLMQYTDNKDETLLDEIFHVLRTEASTGNMQAVKELLDRSFGKAKQPIVGGSETDEPIQAVIMDKKDYKKARQEMLKSDDC